MLVSPNAKFHIGLVPQHWYQNSFVLGAGFSAEPAISAISYNSKTALGKKIWFYEKTLNLAIATGRVKELYAIHKDFIGEMENEVASQVSCADNIAEKRKQIPGSDQDDKENKAKRPQKILQDEDLNVSESSKPKGRKCGICNKEGHNARTCLRG
ncbi:23575_t:CDS:2, partial [Gigaspora rosea]